MSPFDWSLTRYRIWIALIWNWPPTCLTVRVRRNAILCVLLCAFVCKCAVMTQSTPFLTIDPNPLVLFTSLNPTCWYSIILIKRPISSGTAAGVGSGVANDSWGFIYFHKLLTMSMRHVFNLWSTRQRGIQSFFSFSTENLNTATVLLMWWLIRRVSRGGFAEGVLLVLETLEAEE